MTTPGPMTKPGRIPRQFRPWQPGGGRAAEVWVFPPGAGVANFDWRISTAVVARSGPFSA